MMKRAIALRWSIRSYLQLVHHLERISLVSFLLDRHVRVFENAGRVHVLSIGA